MAKKNNNAIYAPGELDRVRGKLGKIDNDEAKRVADILGGEVGTERTAEPDPVRGKRARHETVEVVVNGQGRSRKSGRRVDLANLDEEEEELLGKQRTKAYISYPGDDPTVPARLHYFDRVKIDQLCGQMVFEIKNPMQILVSIFSFFKEPTDYVNSRFVTNRMNEYYHKIEVVVTSTRNLLPLNNNKRNNQLKRASSFVYKVIDVLRSWNIEKIAGNIAELQSHPRNVRVTDYADILRNIYRPLFILEDLNTENIKSAFKLVYKILYIESPMDAKEKYQDIIRNLIGAFIDIRRDVQYCLYPLLMKLISDKFLQYERFFIERQRRFQAFLIVTPQDQLKSSDFSSQQVESLDVESLKENINNDEPADPDQADGSAEEQEEDPNDPQVAARRAKEEAEKAEFKAIEQGKTALEILFPKAGWNKLDEFPDLYPYFAGEYNLRRGYELISPADPLQQVAVIMLILEDIFYGMRYVKFGTVAGPDGHPVNINDEISETISNWRGYIDDSFVKEYLPRLAEYCRMLENSAESRISMYAKKNINELHWIKRLYFLPYYKFESLGPPPFQKQDVSPIYNQVRALRRYLTIVALGIEQGNHAGGAPAKAPCNGINNPWEQYNFEVPNPVSWRLNTILPPERRNNASLVFFSLAAVTVLDFIINNENSWAYNSRPGALFRSIKNEGIMPQFGVDEKIDAEKVFKESLRRETK